MKVLLIGATGLLGHNVLRLLVEGGHDVVCLVRREAGIRLEPKVWRTVVGSPLDETTLANAAEDCDAVVNCAGTTDMSLRHAADYLPMNSELCSRIVAMCEKRGIRTIVHTSTVNTIGYGDDEAHPGTEDMPMRHPFRGSFYADSKLLGEEIMVDAATRHPDWHVVVVNPGFMLGAYDVKPSSGRMLLAAYRRRLMVAPSGGKAFVHVKDVAQAEVNALTMGRNGGKYIVTGQSLTVRRLYEMQASLMGYGQRVLALPDWLLKVAGVLGDVVRACGLKTELSSHNVRQLMVREHYDSGRVVDELKINITPIGEAIKDFYKWRQED